MWQELIQAWKSSSLLTEAWDESYEMLAIDERMFREAIHVLRESDDAVVNPEIKKLDARVNKYERDVRRKVMTHCTVVGTRDLPAGMVLVSIVIDIERIGDYCKNILDLAAAHPKRLIVPECGDVLVEVESGIKQGFAEAVSILREHDEEKARQAMIHYRDRVSDACDEIVSNIVRGRTDCVIPGDAAALALYVRFIKRISAHLKNMFSSVVNPFHRIGYKEKQPKHR